MYPSGHLQNMDPVQEIPGESPNKRTQAIYSYTERKVEELGASEL